MRKKMIVGLLFLFVLSGVNVSVAQEAQKKGANEKAYEHADENAVFNQVGDWFATIGKSDEEKAKIKAERKAKRELKRAEKHAKKELQKKEKQIKKAMGDGDEVEDKAKKMKKKMKKKKE